MTMDLASEREIFSRRHFLSCITIAKQPCFGSFIYSDEAAYCCLFFYSYFILFEPQPASKDAISATIVAGGQTILMINIV